MTAKYVLVVAKKDERVGGDPDAALTFTVPVDVVREDDFDATTEFMRGRLKAAGHAGEVLDLLKAGTVTTEFRALLDAV